MKNALWGVLGSYNSCVGLQKLTINHINGLLKMLTVRPYKILIIQKTGKNTQ